MGINTRLKIYGIGAIVWVIVLIIAVFSGLAHGSTSLKHSNSLGALIYQYNPNQYLMGLITSGTVTEYNKKLYTVIRFRPTNTYGLFSQDFAYCGNVASMFEGMTGVIVVTFSKTMHSRDCYDLYRVDKVASKEIE